MLCLAAHIITVVLLVAVAYLINTLSCDNWKLICYQLT